MSSSLLLDIGNSRLKWRLEADIGSPASGAQMSTGSGGLDLDGLLRSLSNPPAEAWISSVVAAPAQALMRGFGERGIAAHCARSLAALDGLTSGYSDPSQLGVDRFLALLGAHRRWPGQNCVVVDAGTALTVDLLRDDGQHLGGCILPGLRLMAAALAGGTDRLGPHSQVAKTAAAAPGTVADHTAAAIGLGIDHAVLGAIERIRASHPAWPILICGGDADRLADMLSPPCQVHHGLVLDGLARYAELARASSLRSTH